MPGPGRIIYYIVRSSGPSGGIKVLLEHVRTLRAAGFDAYAYTKNQDQRPTAFEVDAPILSGAINITAKDVIIRPETFSHTDLVAAAKAGLWQAVFVQNHYFCRHGLGPARRYAELGIPDVYCASQRIKRFLETNGIASDVPVIPCAVEMPDSIAGKVERIAVMPRKRRFEFNFIRHHFALRYPDLADIPWAVIENMPHSEVLETLARSTLFLSLQRLEGFGLPALEAMAAGCLVAGFAGDGGWDYADAANGSWVQEDALEEAADALAAAARGLRGGDPRFRAMVEAGRSTAARFGAEARDKALIGYFETLLTRGPGENRT
jgi:glycosyltransferase involved in cell wall biosynthesis